MLAERERFLREGYWKIILSFILVSVLCVLLSAIFLTEAFIYIVLSTTPLLPFFIALYGVGSMQVLYVFSHRAKNGSLKRFEPQRLADIALAWTVLLASTTLGLAVWAVMDAGSEIGLLFVTGEILAALACYDLYSSSRELRKV